LGAKWTDEQAFERISDRSSLVPTNSGRGKGAGGMRSPSQQPHIKTTLGQRHKNH